MCVTNIGNAVQKAMDGGSRYWSIAIFCAVLLYWQLGDGDPAKVNNVICIGWRYAFPPLINHELHTFNIIHNPWGWEFRNLFGIPFWAFQARKTFVNLPGRLGNYLKRLGKSKNTTLFWYFINLNALSTWHNVNKFVKMTQEFE